MIIRVKSLVKTRGRRGWSQRLLAGRAQLAYKTLQLLESGRHDPRVSTLTKLATALGYPSAWVQGQIEGLFALPDDAVAVIAERIQSGGKNSWKLWLFNFVDAFRAAKDKGLYIETPPAPKTSLRIRALLASTVETLCQEVGIKAPLWCKATPGLSAPWFVAEVENLKVMALMTSPVHFRKRNIFVLDNFLERA